MSAQSISVLKSYFETGDVPTEAQFADLIDTIFSMVATATKNQANGVAGLDGSALIAIAQLQAIIDDASNAATNKTWSITKVKGLLDTLTANIAAINLILESNDINLDDVQEIVDAVKALQTSSTLLAGKLVDTSGRATGKILEYDETLNEGQGGYKHVDKGEGGEGENPTWSTASFNGIGGTTTNLDLQSLNNPGVYFEATAGATTLALLNIKTGTTTKVVVELQVLFDGITELAATFPSNFYEEGVLIEGPISLTAPIDTIKTYQFIKRGTNWEFYRAGGASGDSNNLGWFTNESALTSAHPTGTNSQFAIVGATDTIWIWDGDTNTWKNSGNSASTVPKSLQATVNAGSIVNEYVAPDTLAGWWTNIKTLAQTFAAKITFTTAPRFSSVTASQVLKVDANKDMSSGPVANSEMANMPANTAKVNNTGISSPPIDAALVNYSTIVDVATEVSSNYSMLSTDRSIQVTSTAAPRTITLLDPASVSKGRKIPISDFSNGAGTNNITIATAAGSIIGTTVISSNGGSRTYESDGVSKWLLIASV